MNRREHWERTYTDKPVNRVGWYSPHLETSLALIRSTAIDADEPVLDVGGGASTLVDDLLADGYRDLSVLDLAESALAITRERLAADAAKVHWLTGDITAMELPRIYGVWHDRAVFHFLVDAQSRERYRDQLDRALKTNGWLVLGVFAPDGPSSCSGLPVQRYSETTLQQELGDGFALEQSRREVHVTPGGKEQAYLYGLFRKTG